MVSEVYPPTGTPAKLQPEIVRSFILMSHLGEHSITKWVAKLKSDSLLALMIGVNHDAVPEVGNHYGLINRLWLANPDCPDQDSRHPFRRKPRKNLPRTRSYHHVTLALFKNLLISPYRISLLITDLRDCFNKYLTKLL